MTALKHTSLFTSVLISTALLASPLALAGQDGDKNGHQGKRHHAGLCEKIKDGDRHEQRANYEQKWLEHHEEVAERLELTEEQRETWDEIREERQEKFQQRMEKLKERCEEQSEQ